MQCSSEGPRQLLCLVLRWSLQMAGREDCQCAIEFGGMRNREYLMRCQPVLRRRVHEEQQIAQSPVICQLQPLPKLASRRQELAKPAGRARGDRLARVQQLAGPSGIPRHAGSEAEDQKHMRHHPHVVAAEDLLQPPPLRHCRMQLRRGVAGKQNRLLCRLPRNDIMMLYPSSARLCSGGSGRN